jgi:hypothetical protein
MREKLIAVGLVAALAVPTAAIAAPQGSHDKKATTTAPRTRAKSSANRSALRLRTKPSKTTPVGARTGSRFKPKARSRSGHKPKAHASTGRSRTVVRTRRNRTTRTAPINISVGTGGGSGLSGAPGVGGVDLPVSLSGAGV